MATDPNCDFVDVQCGKPQSHTGSMGHHCSRVASASEDKVEQIDLRLLSNQQVRAIAHSAPALQSDDLARVFDSTNLALASDHQARAFDSTTLGAVEDPFQSDVLQHCSSGHLHH